jgi:hypothetical protein
VSQNLNVRSSEPDAINLLSFEKRVDFTQFECPVKFANNFLSAIEMIFTVLSSEPEQINLLSQEKSTDFTGTLLNFNTVD